MSSARYRVVLGATCGRISGVDVFTVHLARGLRDAGIDATVLMTEGGDDVPDPLPFPSDITVHDLSMRRGGSYTARWHRIAMLLESMAPCIYIPNYDFAHSPASALLSDRVGVVGVIHSDDPDHYDHVARLGRFWNRVVSVSPLITAEVGRRFPELQPRQATIPYGVPVPDESLRPRPIAPGTLRLLYAGRLVQHQKRVMDLAEIARHAVHAGVALQLSIVGSGAEEPALRAACAPLMANGTVRFLGTLSNADVLRQCDEHDAFILPSEFEGLPVSLLEAMGRGCVPLVTDIRSGIPDVVRDGENGFVVPVGDVKMFAARLQQLFVDAPLLARMSQASQKMIRDKGYSTASMTARYTAEFDRLWQELESGAWRRPSGPPVPPSWMLPLWKHHIPLTVRRIAGRVLWEFTRFRKVPS